MAGRTVGRNASLLGLSRPYVCALAGLLAVGCMTPAQPYNQRGVALFKAGQYDAARAEFLQATYADPSNADAFYNLGSRIVKFHMAPSTIEKRGLKLDSPELQPFFDAILDRKMAVMTHVGDPDTWYCTKYADCGKFGSRDEHYAMWQRVMERYFDVPWIGAHMGGNPENLPRLQSLLDNFPNLSLDGSATRWMVREISARRDEAREFFIKNADRIMWGSDQVSGDDRGFDFLASRWWAHRKLWETAYIGPTPIFDPDLPEDRQPQLRGLALPDEVLQKLYHDNAIKFLSRIGATFDGWG